MSMWKDFKAFAFKGNVIDLAIAVVIATAFGKIVTVIVDALIMPLIGKVIPGGSYAAWAPGGIKLGLVIAAALTDYFDGWLPRRSKVASQFGALGPAGLPSTVLLDRQHRVASRLFGAVTARQLAPRLDALREEPIP